MRSSWKHPSSVQSNKQLSWTRADTQWHLYTAAQDTTIRFISFPGFSSTRHLSDLPVISRSKGGRKDVPRNRISKLFFLAAGKVGGGGVKFCERARLERISTCVQQQDSDKCAVYHMTSCCFMGKCTLWLLTYTEWWRIKYVSICSRYFWEDKISSYNQELGWDLWNQKIHYW